jgi:PAS domain S-box-containing protein
MGQLRDDPDPTSDGGETRRTDAPAYRAAFAAAFAAIGDPVVMFDGGSRIVDANARTLDALGSTLTQLKGTLLSAIVPAGGVSELPARLAPGESMTVPARLAAPIAGTTSIELRVTRLALDGPPLFACVLRPLAPPAFALYNQLATLLDQAPWICFQKDVAGRYEYVNRQYAEVYGLAQQSVVGCTDADLFSPDVTQTLRDNDRVVADSGRVLVTEESVPESDGSHLFLVYKFPIRDPAGRVVSTGGIAVDITESRRLETSLQDAALAEQQRLSHELHDGVGQELATLSLLTAKLIRQFGSDNPPLADALGALLDVVARVGKSCRNIARGLSPIDDAEKGLPGALRELVERLSRSMDVPKISFSEGRSAPLKIPLEASNHLYRIAQEALSNAVKHSGARRVTVLFDVDQDLVRLIITDDGRGTDSREHEGMGLRTMQHRAEAIGASFAVQALPDGGTAVTCEIRSTAQSKARPRIRPPSSHDR